MNKKEYIGISGFARSGKNLFAEVAIDVLKGRGWECSTHSLAYLLKKECGPFLMDKFGISAFTEKTEEKNIIRPLLIWFGMEMRKRNRRVWIDKLDAIIKHDPADFIFITDIRFSKFAGDETDWLQNELNGKLIHISKYRVEDGSRFYVPAGSKDEEENDPLVKERADLRLEWEHLLSTNYADLKTNPEIVRTVRESLDIVLKHD